MAPPRTEAAGQGSVEGPGGRPRRGGSAGEISLAKQGFSLSTLTWSSLLPTCKVKYLGPLAITW